MKVGSHHCSIFTYLHYSTVRFFFNYQNITFNSAFILESFVQTVVLKGLPYLYDLKRQKLAQDFAVIRPRNYFLLWLGQTTFLGCSTSLLFLICEFANLCICILQSQLSSFTSLNPLQISQFIRILSGRNLFFHVPTAVSRDMYETFILIIESELKKYLLKSQVYDKKNATLEIFHPTVHRS